MDDGGWDLVAVYYAYTMDGLNCWGGSGKWQWAILANILMPDILSWLLNVHVNTLMMEQMCVHGLDT